MANLGSASDQLITSETLVLLLEHVSNADMSATAIVDIPVGFLVKAHASSV